MITSAQESREKAFDAKKKIETREAGKAIFSFDDKYRTTPGYNAGLSVGLYAESGNTSGGYDSAMQELVDSGDLPEKIKSNDSNSYFYYEGED